jgi:hypothetical protein
VVLVTHTPDEVPVIASQQRFVKKAYSAEHVPAHEQRWTSTQALRVQNVRKNEPSQFRGMSLDHYARFVDIVHPAVYQPHAFRPFQYEMNLLFEFSWEPFIVVI